MKWAVFLCLLNLFSLTFAADEDFSAPLAGKRLAHPPVIDGKVSEEEWSGASFTESFWYTQEQKPAPHRTRCYAAYDEEFLYFAFICDDPTPQAIRREEFRRNYASASDDMVAVGIDPSGRKQEPYWFYLNPRGNQTFTAPGESSDPNIAWQGDWEGAAQVTPTGWNAEFKIPARMVRPPRNQKRFGLIFVRNLPSRQQFYTYPRMGSAYMDETNSVSWENVQISSLRYLPLIKPFLKADTQNGGTQSSGLDARYIDPGGRSTLLTINPDFGDVEGDIAGIDFTYTERYLEERRSFFLEGANYLPLEDVFYSPRLEDVKGGVKSFGRLGAWQYGVLGISDASNRFNGASRIAYQISERSQVHFDTTIANQPGISNQVYGLGFNTARTLRDGEIALRGFHYLSSVESIDGAYSNIEIERKASDRRLNLYLGYSDVSDNFYPALGYLPERGYKATYGIVSLADHFETGRLYDWQASVYFNHRQRQHGGLFDSEIGSRLSATLRNQLSLSYGYTHLERPPNLDRVHSLALGWKVYEPRKSGRAFVSFGKQNGGDSFYYGFEQNLTPLNRLRVGLVFQQITLNYPDELGFEDYEASQVIMRFTYDLNSESGLAGRVTATGRTLENSDSNFFISYWRRVRKGADLYFIWGLPNADRFENRFAVKLVLPYGIGF